MPNFCDEALDSCVRFLNTNTVAQIKSVITDRKDLLMEKELLIKWLRVCSEEDGGEGCEACPFAGCEDCAGELMKEAAQVLAGKEG